MMRATTIQQIEEAPLAYPDTPSGLSPAAAALDPAVVWARIESYVAHRWTARAVVWVVEGPGSFEAPLTPAIVTTIERWEGEAWTETTLPASPLGGYMLESVGPCRFTASVGAAVLEVPAGVQQAFRRLAEYTAARVTMPGASSETVVAGSIRVSKSREPAWMAKAMQNSGAGDLLRRYRSAP